MVFDTAAKSVDAVTREEADFGFFAVDPVRGAGIGFTAPYVLIEGSYLVRQDSPLTDNAQVDRAGHTVVVGKGSAYDLYLSRELKHAQIGAPCPRPPWCRPLWNRRPTWPPASSSNWRLMPPACPACACCRAASW